MPTVRGTFFSEKEEKERKLEKTILSLSQKGSKIVKAGTLSREPHL